MSEIAPGISLARITPPPPVPHFLFREELVNRLNRPAPRATFAIAPGGFGKTSLASQWASQIEDPIFWYTIESRDSARDSFFHIIEGLRLAVPGFAPWANDFLESELDYPELTRRLCNDIGKLDHSLTLIWDGSDKFAPEFTPALLAFAEMAPYNLRTLSLRGTIPNQSFSRAAKLDALDFITAADLRFSEHEIKAILAQNNLDYEDPAIAAHFDGVQGWPAGVQMIINRLLDEKPKNSKRLNDQVIVEATVENMSDRDREYLEHLIFLDEITLDQAQRLIQYPLVSFEDHPLLRLSSQGYFVNEISSGVYEMNSLIRDELLRRMARDLPLLKEHALKAANLYEADKNPIKMVEILSIAGEEALAAKKAYSYLAQIINSGDAKILKSWAKKVSSLIKLGGTPELNEKVLDAYVQVMTGDNIGALATCLSVENGMRDFGNPEGYTVELWGLRARAHFNLGNFDEVIAVAEEMLISPHTQGEYGAATIRITNVLRIAVAASFLREDYDATLKYSTPIDRKGDPLVNLVIVPATQALTAIADGRFKRAFDFANSALSTSIRSNVVGTYSAFDAVYVMSDYYRESGEEEKAIALLDEYIPIAINHGVWSWYAALMGKKALTKSQQGFINEALIHLREARTTLSNPEFGSEIFRILDEQELLIRVKFVDSERIGELLYRLPQTPTTQAFATTYAAKKSPASAKSLLEKYPTHTPRLAMNRELISAEVFSDSPQVAQSHLAAAIDIAMANGAKQVFLNQSSVIQNHLLTLASSRPTVFMEQLSASIRKGQSISARDHMGLAEPLTKREIDILRRLSSGLPITQIASTLHISHNTIKTHLKSVYRKLNVESRSEAVERGKELLLL